MKQAIIEVIDHGNGSIEFRRVDGKKKVIPKKRYRLLQSLKSAGIILGAVLMAILFCGAAITSENPAKVVQAIFLFGAAAFAIISAIVWSVTGGGEEKRKDNRKISKRR